MQPGTPIYHFLKSAYKWFGAYLRRSDIGEPAEGRNQNLKQIGFFTRMRAMPRWDCFAGVTVADIPLVVGRPLPKATINKARKSRAGCGELRVDCVECGE